MDFSIYKKNYYCLISGLPDLVSDNRQTEGGDLSLKFRNDLLEQLDVKDRKLAKLFYLKYDNKNLLNLLLKQNKAFDTLANYNKEDLIEYINDPSTADDYISLAYKTIEGKGSKGNTENALQSLYYAYVSKAKNGFVKKWFRFEKNIKNVLTAVNCRKYGYSLQEQLISVDNDNEVYNILIENDPKDAAMISNEVEYANEILKIVESSASIAEKEKQIDLIKWRFLDESTFFDYFTIEKILSYIVKLEIVDRWSKVSNETGSAFFSKLMHELKSSYVIPEEFDLKRNRGANVR